MPEILDAKVAAKRVDATYVRRWRWLQKRMFINAIVGLVGAAGLWLAYARYSGKTAYSPGPLASAHAMWGTDCAQCHQGTGSSFNKAVSDAACRACHDGAVHHVAQTAFLQSRSRSPGHGGENISAGGPCSTCHVEHRGHDILMARDDRTCTQCHRDLLRVIAGGSLQVQRSVERFAPDEHPPFGRSLKHVSPGGAGPAVLMDPTPLKFNHKIHMPGQPGAVAPLSGETLNCTACHPPATADSTGIGDRPDRRYMMPVRYQEHCASCHPIELVKGITLAHTDLRILRPGFQGIAGDRKGFLISAISALNERASKELRTAHVSRRRSRSDPTMVSQDVVQSIDAWAESQVDKVEDNAKSIEEKIVRYNGTGACVKCHVLSDDTPAVSALVATAGPPMAHAVVAELIATFGPHPATLPTTVPSSGTQPTAASNTGPLATLPTGIAKGPRRWFINSVFDHDAHRSVMCTDCHYQATNSKQMQDVLLPAQETCMMCHHSPDSRGPGADASCQECHVFHDRSKESKTRSRSIADLLPKDR